MIPLGPNSIPRNHFSTFHNNCSTFLKTKRMIKFRGTIISQVRLVQRKNSKLDQDTLYWASIDWERLRENYDCSYDSNQNRFKTIIMRKLWGEHLKISKTLETRKASRGHGDYSPLHLLTNAVTIFIIPESLETIGLSLPFPQPY